MTTGVAPRNLQTSSSPVVPASGRRHSARLLLEHFSQLSDCAMTAQAHLLLDIITGCGTAVLAGTDG